MGDAWRDVEEEGTGDISEGSRTAISIVLSFVGSGAHALMLESAATLLPSLPSAGTAAA